MPRKAKEVEAGLVRKGFRRDDTHHKYYIYFTAAGKKTAVATYTSQGAKELDDYLLGQMARQCKLSRPAFCELVDCTLSQIEYEDGLTKKGHVRTAPA